MDRFTLVKCFTFKGSKDHASITDYCLHSWRELNKDGKWENRLASCSEIGPKQIHLMFPFLAASMEYADTKRLEYVTFAGIKVVGQYIGDNINIKYYEKRN